MDRDRIGGIVEQYSVIADAQPRQSFELSGNRFT
jgi:hypothetical protein